MDKPLFFSRVLAEAMAAGELALKAATPTPMVVVAHKNQLDDSSPVVYREVVDGGVCGFAWVVLTPGTNSFARWMVKNGHAGKHYYGGVSFWVKSGGQSMERKIEYAHAFAKVLKSYNDVLGLAGIDPDSRMD